MKEEFLFQEIRHDREKRLIKSVVKPLTCHVCNREIDGSSITAKTIDGKQVFLCSNHFRMKPVEIIQKDLIL